MAAKKSKPREPRPNQFGITLGPKYAALLRTKAEELNEPPTTLGRRLLEKALAERATPLELASERAGDLGALLKELRALRRAHHNATVKLLSRGGMSAEDLAAWVKEYLEK